MNVTQATNGSLAKQIEILTGHRQTGEKAEFVCQTKGYQATGVVLSDGQGRLCTVHLGKVLWFDNEEGLRAALGNTGQNVEYDAQEAGDLDKETIKQITLDAAKAAGLKVVDGEHAHIPSGGIWIVGENGQDVAWNPKGCEIDAFRLAVKMGFKVEIDSPKESSRPSTTVRSSSRQVLAVVGHGSDSLAATRKAIWLAAAATQRKMYNI